jgi:hypothetical protein
MCEFIEGINWWIVFSGTLIGVIYGVAIDKVAALRRDYTLEVGCLKAQLRDTERYCDRLRMDICEWKGKMVYYVEARDFRLTINELELKIEKRLSDLRK